MCVEEYFRIYLLHLEARSLLIGNRKVSNWIVFREKSDILLVICDSVVISEDFDG